MLEIISYGLEHHFKGKTFNNVEELEQQVCRRLGMVVKLNKKFFHPQLNMNVMVKVEIKEEKHPRVGVEFILVEKIELIEM